MKFRNLRRLADFVMLSSGWRRRMIAFGAGAIGVIALPPFDFFPALIVTMVAAVWLLDGTSAYSGQRSGFRVFLRTSWEAAKIGWWFGFGYFLAGLWWLGAAFLVEADQFAWALPLGVLGLPAALAAFPAFGFALARLIWSNSAARIFALAAALGASEWLRSVVMTGFPWNNFGMAFGGNLVLAQFGSVIGLHGLTILSVGLAAAPALIADRVPRRLPIFMAIILFAGLAAFGFVRLSDDEVAFHQQVKLRIMQPNLPQDEKFRPDAMPQVLAKYIELSGRATQQQPDGIAGVTHLIWPESPFPVVIGRDPPSLQRIGDFLAPNTTLITGAVRAESLGEGRGAIFFNAIQAMGPGGVILDTYDKVHLVPFGEYLPFRRLLDAVGLRQFVHVPGGFEAGAGRRLIQAPGFPPAAPLICYEAIFPGAVLLASRTQRAEVLLNVTNDGWFGDTPGPRQHFAQARLRAIEEGLPLVRAANTGVSAIVDPYGRVLESLPVGVEGVIDGSLPLPKPPTFFSAYPTAAPMTLLLISFGLALLFRRGGRTRAAS